MGAGKSVIGQRLSLELGLDYYDLDAEIEKKTGYTITETIFNKGELFFRKLEHERLKEIFAQHDNFVLSTGGGTPCYYDNIDIINQNSLSVFVKYNVSELYNRLEGAQHERPLIAHLSGEPLKEYIGKHLFERNSYYEKATMVINATGKTLEELTGEIKKLVHE